jgi:excisionase family DNA binding protein
VKVFKSPASPNLAEYLTVGEAAKFLGVSPWTLRNWDRDGRLKSMRHPKNGYRIYRQHDLEAVLEARQITGHSDAGPAPRFHWSHACDHEHLVQLYESDDYLATSVGAYFESGLRSGEGCVLIATPAHRDAVEAALAAGGSFDLEAARARGQYVSIDAAEALSQFMVGAQPDPARFAAAMGKLVRATARGRPGARAFGEMVALLWADGNRAGAIRLEELWNDLQRRHKFTLFCAYPMSGFADDEHGLGDVCATHSRVVPAESYNALSSPDERLRQVALLQQKAAALEAEVARHRATERALREAKAAAEQASRAKDQFLAVLSHELRTPLTPVLMSVAALEAEACLPPRLREDLAMIRRNVALETQLIDDLLDLSRVINGKMVLHAQDLDVHPLIRNVAEMVAPEAQARPVTLRLNLCAARDRVRGDSARLHQVLWNLLKNAIKFTPAAGTITVRTRDDATSGRLVVDVQDTGIGIEPGALPDIFNAFDQGEHGGNRAFGGLGLGLAISKAVVEMHGGALRAHSDGPGRGACFTLDLATVAAVETPSPSAAPQHAGGARPGGSLRILLVDDHLDTLKMLRRLLEGAGHVVTAADCVAGAVRAADDAGQLDLLISDIGLPDGTGLDLMREIRGRHPCLPAIALTGYGMEQDLRNSEQAGFGAHLTKPIDFNALKAAISKLVT